MALIWCMRWGESRSLHFYRLRDLLLPTPYRHGMKGWWHCKLYTAGKWIAAQLTVIAVTGIPQGHISRTLINWANSPPGFLLCELFTCHCLIMYSLIIMVCSFSSFSSKPIVDYINEQFEIYLQEELKIKRALHSYHDTRVHVCLYFIAPTGHS